MHLTLGDGKTPILAPDERGMITFRIEKKLMNFEDYPNDVQRGFNIWHMPLFYQTEEVNGKSHTEKLYSNSLLVMTPEPDFSMPFNVNAVTHMLFGIFFVNTVYILFKEHDEDEEEETTDKKDVEATSKAVDKNDKQE